MTTLVRNSRLVVGHNNVAGGLWVEWAENENGHEVHNHARRMIHQARKEAFGYE